MIRDCLGDAKLTIVELGQAPGAILVYVGLDWSACIGVRLSSKKEKQIRQAHWSAELCAKSVREYTSRSPRLIIRAFVGIANKVARYSLITTLPVAFSVGVTVGLSVGMSVDLHIRHTVHQLGCLVLVRRYVDTRVAGEEVRGNNVDLRDLHGPGAGNVSND